jgi:hypothetical protein
MHSAGKGAARRRPAWQMLVVRGVSAAEELELWRSRWPSDGLGTEAKHPVAQLHAESHVGAATMQSKHGFAVAVVRFTWQACDDGRLRSESVLVACR